MHQQNQYSNIFVRYLDMDTHVGNRAPRVWEVDTGRCNPCMASILESMISLSAYLHWTRLIFLSGCLRYLSGQRYYRQMNDK